MIKKKKKLSYSEQQKQQKLQQAQYKNLFIQKLREVCVAIGDATLFNLIPPVIIDLLYSLRSAPLKIKAAKGAKVQKRLIEVIETQIKHTINKTTIEMIPGSGRSLPLTDYALAGTVLELYLLLPNCHIRQQERFAEFTANIGDRIVFYYNHICSVCENICAMYNDMSSHKGLYAFSFARMMSTGGPQEQVIEVSHQGSMPEGKTNATQAMESGDRRPRPIVSITMLPLDVKQVQIDGENRSAIALSMMSYSDTYESKLVPAVIPLSEIDPNKAFGDLKLPVYIQQHAFHRLTERTGCLIPNFTDLCLNQSVEKSVITKLHGDKFLVEFRIEELKVGYLLCEVLHGMVLIRTFLFITNSGTPEGDKLAALTNLQREDRKYLAIDNLRSLLGSDILENDTISKLFQQAGCQSILDLCSKVKDSQFLKDLLGITEQKTSLSELMMEYLNPLADNDEYVIGE
jgi:hypothetical protein